MYQKVRQETRIVCALSKKTNCLLGTRQLLSKHEQQLKEQLAAEESSAVAFQQAVLLLWLKHNQSMVHIPHKFIQLLVTKLKDKMPPQQHDILKQTHALVVKYLTAKAKSEKEDIRAQLVEKMPQLKELVDK